MSGASVTDRLALAALVGVVPVSTVDDVLGGCGLSAERVRALPPWVTTYHVLCSALRPSATYDEVTDLVWAALPAATGRRLARQRPSTGAITRARARLGEQPLSVLLDRTMEFAPTAGFSDTIYLQRFQEGGLPSLWWICDAQTGSLRGCDVRGDDVGAAASLLRRSGATRVIACTPAADALLLAGGPAEVVTHDDGVPPTWIEVPWVGLRARTHGAWRQLVLARACVAVAAETALHAASRDAAPRRPFP